MQATYDCTFDALLPRLRCVAYDCAFDALLPISNSFSTIYCKQENFHGSIDFIKIWGKLLLFCPRLYFKPSFCYVKVKQLKLVGKTFAVYRKFMKAAKVFYRRSFLVFGIVINLHLCSSNNSVYSANTTTVYLSPCLFTQ